MFGNRTTTLCLMLALMALSASEAAHAQVATGKALANGLEQAFGKHPGKRRAHPKGVCASGEFTPTKLAKTLSKSLLFDGGTVAVTARFSNAGGDPAAADSGRTPRGLALHFTLKDKSLHQMALISTPVFTAATPETFLGLLNAQRLDPVTGACDAARIATFRAAHPDLQPQINWLAEHNPPASYATVTYFGVHAFEFLDAAGTARKVRFRFAPAGGDVRLSDSELEAAPADFLRDEIVARLNKGPATWQLIVQLGEPSDPTDDPTREWPAGRKEIVAGSLQLKAAEAGGPGFCDTINFDPTVVSEGVELSNDPILRARSDAYAASAARRRAELKTAPTAKPAR